jgi:hypothetical protein
MTSDERQRDGTYAVINFTVHGGTLEEVKERAAVEAHRVLAGALLDYRMSIVMSPADYQAMGGPTWYEGDVRVEPIPRRPPTIPSRGSK